MSPRSPLSSLAAACLFALAAAACSRAPAESLADPVPPPRRPYDAKTQLEYGDPRPPAPAQRY